MAISTSISVITQLKVKLYPPLPYFFFSTPQSWYDYKLRWEPKEYGGVQMLHVPSDHIWRPDIVVRG